MLINEKEVIMVSEELINNKDFTLKKYKNKIFQIKGEIFEIARSDHSGHRKGESSGITLREKNSSFIFFFDFDVTKLDSLKTGDIVTLQGTLWDFNKRVITEYDYERKKASEKYWEEVERSFFIFKKSSIIPVEYTHGRNVN